MSTPPLATRPALLADLVADATGTSVLHCYQCGRCAAGCPQNLPGYMAISPTRIIHLLQLEAAFADDLELADSFAREALSSATCWACASCQACTTRCPQGVDIAGTMDVLRETALARGLAATDPRSVDIQRFHQTFLGEALKHGRLNEVALVLHYKLATGHWLQDTALGLGMFRRGKLHPFRDPDVDTGPVRAAIIHLDRLTTETKEGEKS